jgi:hypothetical protein
VAEQDSGSNTSSALATIVDKTLRTLSDADADAAVVRVTEARSKGRLASDDALVEHLIKQKALQSGMVGAVTSGASLIPGFGSLAAFTIGVATDVGVTLRLQAELVLEIAAARGHDLNTSEKRNALLLVTGINMGTERLVNQASRKMAERAAERLAGRAFVKMIPFVGIAVSAGANMITTYIIGRRADAYVRLGPDAVGDWNESLRAITGVDERKLTAWLTEVMSNFGTQVGIGWRRLQASTGSAFRRTGEALRNRLPKRPGSSKDLGDAGQIP